MPQSDQRERRAIGPLLALLAAVAYATVNALLRSVAADVDPFVGSLIRQLPLLVVGLVIVLVLRPKTLRPGTPSFIGLRGVVLLMLGGTLSFLIGNVLLFQGLDLVGLAIATAASQGGMAAGGALVSWIFLKERTTRVQLLAILVVIAGLIVMSAPAFSTETQGSGALLGIVFSALAGTCYTVANVASRSVQRRPKTFITALFLTNLGGVIALVTAVAVRFGGDIERATVDLYGTTLAILFAAGCVNAIAIASVTLAVRFATITVVSTTVSLVIVFGLMIAWLVFDEPMAANTLVGAAIILLGVLLAQLRSRSNKTPESALVADAHRSARRSDADPTTQTKEKSS
ncbi:DMT family transporter [Humidisolicoccus flavus]|uniref:DMT family transporter n=1 Tax=Humidisolicoccus flavus TaxID=3111414 RepID=UPI00324E4AB4